jgi:O-antigen ligase/polysaccharide polymerase Wzy-like membrane protein
VLLVWTTFAFAGVYPGTLVVPAVLCLVLVLAYRPWPLAFDEASSIDRWLVVACVLAFAQFLPLPPVLIDALSPHDRAVWEALSLTAPPTALPLSIDVTSTAWAALVAAGVVAVFITARRIFTVGGVRRVVRMVATAGFALAALALAQDATGHGLMYWRWRPLQEGAPPFGPFVNRNFFGTWVILAVPLVLGYLAAHATAHHHTRPANAPAPTWQQRLRDAIDARTIWLIGSAGLMILALFVSLSRSGLFGLTVALLVGAALQRWSRERRPGARWLVAGLIVAGVVVVARINPAPFEGRIAAAPVSVQGRLLIWRDTIPVVRDFWLTGTGAGTYETAMLVYQRASLGVRFNQAHNHYLQLVTEGGLLLSVPVAIALWQLAGAVARTLRGDRSGMYWLRAGAASGLAGVAAQSIWDTGLTAPANAVLAAISAAIALHQPARAARTD